MMSLNKSNRLWVPKKSGNYKVQKVKIMGPRKIWKLQSPKSKNYGFEKNLEITKFEK